MKNSENISSILEQKLTVDLLYFNKPNKALKEVSNKCDVTAKNYDGKTIYQFLQDRNLPNEIELCLNEDECCYLSREDACSYSTWQRIEEKIKMGIFPAKRKQASEKQDRENNKNKRIKISTEIESDQETFDQKANKKDRLLIIKDPIVEKELTIELLRFHKPDTRTKEVSNTCNITAKNYDGKTIYQFLQDRNLPNEIELCLNEGESCYLKREDACSYSRWQTIEKKIKGLSQKKELKELTVDSLKFHKPDNKNKEVSNTCDITAKGYDGKIIYQFLQNSTLPSGIELCLNEGKCCLRREKVGSFYAWQTIENKIKNNREKKLTIELLKFHKPDLSIKEVSNTCNITANGYDGKSIYQLLQNRMLPDGVKLYLSDDERCYLKRKSMGSYTVWKGVENKIKESPQKKEFIDLLEFEKPNKTKAEVSDTCNIAAKGYDGKIIYQFFQDRILPNETELHLDQDESCFLMRDIACSYSTWQRIEEKIKTEILSTKSKQEAEVQSKKNNDENEQNSFQNILLHDSFNTLNMDEIEEEYEEVLTNNQDDLWHDIGEVLSKSNQMKKTFKSFKFFSEDNKFETNELADEFALGTLPTTFF